MVKRFLSMLALMLVLVALGLSCTSCAAKVGTARGTFPIVTPERDAALKFMLDHTVRVYAVCQGGTGGGTGVLLGNLGDGAVIVTAKHVGNRNCLFSVKNHLGSAIVVQRKESKDHDLAFLYVKKKYKGLAPVTMQTPRLGDDVVAVGYPSDRWTHEQKLAVTKGNVAGFYRDRKFMRVTASFLHGSSGGPVWSENGHLMGISVSMLGRQSRRLKRYIPYQGYYFAIPATIVADHL